MNKLNRALTASALLCTIHFATACQESAEPDIEPPVKWQTHLKAAELGKETSFARSEQIYIPVYSQIYSEDNTRSILLAGTLSVRNTDCKESIILKSIAYYDTAGKLLKELCKTPVLLPPLGTAEIVVPRSNTTGGSGANFVVEWVSAKPVSDPIAEAIMISAGTSRNLSFVSRGTVITRPSSQRSDISEPAQKKESPPAKAEEKQERMYNSQNGKSAN